MPERVSSSSAARTEATSSSRQRLKSQSITSPNAKRKRGTKSSSSAAASSNDSTGQNSTSRKRTRRTSINDRDAEPEAAASASEQQTRRKRVTISTKSTESAAAAAARPATKAKTTKPKGLDSKRSKSRKPKAEPKPLEISGCGICFEETFQDAGILDCCQHSYCFACIVKWADSSNTCPQCKRRIKSIAQVDVATGKKKSTKKMKKRDFNASSGGAGAGMLGFGPGFTLSGAEHIQLLLQQGGLGGNDFHAFNPLLYHLFFHNLYDDEDDEDEDYSDEGYDDDESMTLVCNCCYYSWHGLPFDQCPNCLCDGHHSYDEDEDDDDDGWDGGDSDDDDHRGSRENPIEID